MTDRAIQPVAGYLRLVHDEPAGHAGEAARRATARENRRAATLDPDDARWIVASDAARAIEGGRSAILRPESRRRLIASARARGLREFEANLIIAIVQDAARRGHSEPEDSLLAMIPRGESPEATTGRMLAAVVLGAAVFVALMVWLLGA
ncbi:MAG: hypothetical protein HBSAPP03_12420 [Phycisphaerae bacterium]|nr:MAG: hypothetical protein HBSAPP03_12420 [Phycisphaerae bacterium]